MKKLLSIMLSILMVVTMLPMAVMPASAAENESDGVIYCELGPWAGSITALKLRYSSDNSTINDIVMEEVDYNIWKADLSTNNPAGWIVQFLGSNQSAQFSSEGTTIPEGKNCFRITEYNSSSGMYDGVWYQYPCTSHEYKDGICPCGEVCGHSNYTNGKCDACGYECPHEGQNGSCQVCGANLGKLVIDVTDKSSVKIGTGREYYDEDGYIITGTNQNTDVYIYESADLTLKNAVFSRLYIQYAPEDSVINITLDGTTEVELVDVYKAHLIFDGGETDTLKTPSFNTSGNPGSVTVNGGNIILDLVTEYNIPTIECNGGFTINGGTVTASNNYYNVVFNPVTLNGGELNIISTSTDYEAIVGSIIIEKGALLTVSATKGILDMDSDIVMADDAEENDYFFVRYDTESEFAPVPDIKAALDGKTYAEIKIDTHEHSLNNIGKCICGYECPHESITDNKCDDCGAEVVIVTIDMTDGYGDGWNGNAIVIKQFVDGAFEEVETATIENGVSGTFTTVLSKDGIFALSWLAGNYPDECSFTIAVDGETVYECADGSTLTDGQMIYVTCEHTSYTDGKCDVCGYECTHESYTVSKCDVCGYICTHEGQNGSCEICGANLGKLVIDITDKSNVSIGNGKTYYDEDGYIITGTNKDLIVYVYEEGNFVFRNASFKSFWLNGGDYEVTITLEGDNYLGATEDYYCGISFGYHHLTIEGGENDTLNYNGRANAIGTGGNPGTCTVNGGKINAVTETDQNYPTLWSFGGFIMNGGEVTLSNNYHDVVSCPVTLNGGVLNVIGTSTDCAAVNHKITVEKGALLTVSSACGILSDLYGADIVVADDAEENTLLFAKYNTEDEFAPVYDIKSALDGKTYAEIKADTHNHSFTNDECACGFICEHTDREDGFCTVCKRYIYEITHQPTLEEPYVELNNDADALYQWYTATDKVAEVIDGNEIVDKKENTYYEEETGWNGTWYDGVYVEYFDIYLKAGQKLTLIPDAYCMELAIFSLVEYTPVESEECEAGTELTYIAENDGWYSIFAYTESSDHPRLRAYADAYDYTEIENETSARLEIAEIGKKYACKVTYGDGKTEMSDVFEYAYVITHQPTSGEPYVELNDDTDASYQWYEVERSDSEITDENASGNWQSMGVPFDNSVYEDGKWVADIWEDRQYYFMVELEEGDTVNFEFASPVSAICFSIGDSNEYIEVGAAEYSITVEESGVYWLVIPESPVEYVSATMTSMVYVPVEGQNSAKLSASTPGTYACEVTFADGTTEMTDVFEYVYAITHQPTSGEPYVELNDDTDASYQWYEVERRGPEITDENADTVVYDWGESSYDKETGWTGVAYEENITGQDFFTVALKAGETVIVELTGDFTEGVGLWDYNTNYGVLIEAEEGVSSYEITVDADGDYTFFTFVNSGVVTVKAYTGVTNYTAIEGEASAEIKNPEIGKRYVCEVTYGNGTTEMTDVLKYSYAITHQPTSEEPYVETNDSKAAYQWYTVEDDAEEITDENAKTSIGTYSAEYGWSPMIEASSSTQYYFSFDIKAGDKVTFEFSSVPEIIKFSDFIVRPEETTFSYVADLDRNCELIAHYDGTEITARAYLGDATYTAIEGENSAELKNADIGKNYACEVTFADGTTEMSDTFEVTNLHECDFTGEWKYDADKHWKECTCGETGEEAEHTYTDGKCECGYECPHESYTDGVCDVCNYLCPHSFTEFTETVAPKCEEPGWEESYCDYCSIKLEQEIPALDHDWVSGGIERPYQNIDGSWTDGYYYDSCKNDGTHINITGVAKRADYSAYDEAYKSLKAAQKNANLTDAGAAAVNQAVMTGMTMPQNIVEGESTTAYLNNWVKNAQSILAKIENGEYLKADYTEIDEAIASVDTALENASISDEMTKELEDIKADLEALKENENATMADVNALLDRTEAIAETMNNCANGVHSFTKYEEVTAPKCGVAGKEAAICDNGCGVTDEKEIPALSHKDADGDYKCDYGCGHEFEKPAEPEDPSANCDHLCHSSNWFVKNIIWKIVQFFWKLFKMNPVCECGAAHY